MNANLIQALSPFRMQVADSAQLVIPSVHTAQPNVVFPTIESIATGVPEMVMPQSEAARSVSSLPELQHHQERIEKIYRNTKIDQRYLAVNLIADADAAADRQTLPIQTRMQMYRDHAVPLAEKVVRKALSREAMLTAHPLGLDSDLIDSIRLVVFVSSTGFVGPGVDAALISRLGLRRDVARATINFMGCAAAMNGLRVACDHVKAYPTHKALVVCLELSSVNAVFSDDMNDMIIHSIFGDGCAAMVIGACTAEQALESGRVVIRDHLSHLIEATEDGIVLGIQSNGITCTLSRQLPDYIEAGVNPIVEQFLLNHHLTKADIDLWAIHPGGTRIIQKAQQSLGLEDSQVADSWEVLRQHGNMLSPSVLFVLERMLRRLKTSDSIDRSINRNQPVTGLAFSFSPGVGLEGVLFQRA